ncbi:MULTISPECIES: DLW-39 family protein [Sinomonas]|uniref:DLW-39 family protein n=1 Tax=Sinomonas terrae TaxID=2908838 RepID=A0ABS9U6P3_9MICC|nr:MULTISPECIES: DLW-39 family protein [Sinomonas]MCH6472363.1 DLW-39 family protein [Sinomonas terrae]HKU10333.1 DLW-39 family protein [Sinomonas sp.]
MKKLIALAIAAAAGAFVVKKMQESEAQKKVWSTTTDNVE